MVWNWTKDNWPRFTWDRAVIEPLEHRFLLSCGEVMGAVRHFSDEDRNLLRIELLSEEAVRTSAIEGEILDRLSIQSSLRRQFGLSADRHPAKPRERGVTEMTVDVYTTWEEPLADGTLFRWHRMLLRHDRSLETVGDYRQHREAMQIVSGRAERPTIHYEAPPSARVPEEMAAYIAWFNGSAPGSSDPLPALTRAGIGHLYFEAVHPFEDGNGRIGRALAEKSLAQNIGQPSLIALAHAIERDRKTYYQQLEHHQLTLDITAWLIWFAQTVLAAQQATLGRVAFHIAKARFYDRFRGRFSQRQEKAVARMFREGPTGFDGGLSAENYIAITGASRATATRDLHDLVELGALRRTGERRYTRYALNLPVPETGVQTPPG